jgi:dolichyl-phosphate beta-glucosyltransferase
MTTALPQDAGPHDVPLLTIVIPAYNERQRLPRSLKALRRYLDQQPFAAEVIVVDDGSGDGTAQFVAHRALHWRALRPIRTPHRGKGGAVRAGLLAARGAYTFICDADFSMPVAEIAKFLPPHLPHPEVAIAVREGPDAHRYGEPYHRHLMGRAYNAVVKTFALPGIQDSQCGFKLIRTDIAKRLAAAQTLDGWGFDVELLFLARRWGYRIDEIGIDWYYAPSSRISPLRDALSMTRDVLRVRRNARRGLYDAPPDARDESPNPADAALDRPSAPVTRPSWPPPAQVAASRATPATPARERTAR